MGKYVGVYTIARIYRSKGSYFNIFLHKEKKTPRKQNLSTRKETIQTVKKIGLSIQYGRGRMQKAITRDLQEKIKTKMLHSNNNVRLEFFQFSCITHITIHYMYSTHNCCSSVKNLK